MRLYHVNQGEDDEPYIDTEIQDAYGEKGLITEGELLARPKGCWLGCPPED